jgi:hypothetical protein
VIEKNKEHTAINLLLREEFSSCSACIEGEFSTFGLGGLGEIQSFGSVFAAGNWKSPSPGTERGWWWIAEYCGLEYSLVMVEEASQVNSG